MASKLTSEAVFLAPDDAYPFYVTAKRYTSPVFDGRGDNPNSFTLILLHSTGFFKEVWEPTLEDLVDSMPSQSRPIREAWAIECPNHGASAELNEKALQRPENRHNFTCEKYALAVHRFLLADSSKGARVDFLRRNLVGIGHSLGGCALSTLQQLQPRVQFKSVILIEPMMSPGGRECLGKLRFDLVQKAYERRDVWSNRERALQALGRRSHTHDHTHAWDPRTVQAFVKYALREHPGAKFSDTPYRGVTLCCTRDEEAAMYRDVEGPTKPVLHLNEACSRTPVHVIFGVSGDGPDCLPVKVHDALIDPASPRRFASISRVKNAGHLVPQCAPKELAEQISRILVNEKDRPQTAISKL